MWIEDGLVSCLVCPQMERHVDKVDSWADGGWELIGMDIAGEPGWGPYEIGTVVGS